MRRQVMHRQAKRRGLTAGAVAILSLVGISTAHAGAPCKDRAVVLATLAKDYSETPIAIGMASNGGVLEVLAARADSGTFTIIVTMPNGMSCMLASGQHFEVLPMVQLAKGDPA